MHYLISGSSGFLGGAVRRKLQELNHKVSVIKHLDIINFKSYQNIQDDIFKNSPDVFIHAAWDVNAMNWSKTGSQSEFIDATGEIIRYFAKNGLKNVLGIGSCLEYLPAKHKLFENSPVSHENTYIRDKHKMKDLIFKLSDEYDLKVSWARVFHLYGPDDNSKRLIPSLLKGHQENRDVNLRDGNQPINYLHVDDAVTALLRIASKNILSKSIYNVSGDMLINSGSIKKAIENNNFKFDQNHHEILSASLKDFYWGSNDKLKELGWKPVKDFGIELGRLINAC